MSNTEATDLHNRLAGDIVARIVRPVIEAGGRTEDVMVLCESVVVGVSLACIKLGGDEKVLQIMFDAAAARLAELRLKDIEPEGRA